MNDVDADTQQQIIAAAHELGVINGDSQAAPRLLSALCQPEATAQSIARLISSEPGLAARVLKVANSPFYGVTRAIATIDRAVVVLGLDSVRGIAAAACLDRSLARGDSMLEHDATAPPQRRDGRSGRCARPNERSLTGIGGVHCRPPASFRQRAHDPA